jgi:hypothetical protein
MKKIYSTFILTFILLNVYAQQPTFDWAKGLGSNSMDIGQVTKVDDFGFVYTTGIFNGTVDFDPSPTGVFIMSTPGTNASFIQKMDSNGNFIWAKKFDGNICYITSFDVNTNIYLVGHYQGSTDFDPDSANTFYLLDTATFFTKLNLNGDLIWVKSIKADNASNIEVDNNSNLLITGSNSNSIVDFNPSPTDTFNLTTGLPDGQISFTYLLKLDSDGNFIWVKRFEGSLNFNDISSDGIDNIYITGSFQSTVDFNPNDTLTNSLTYSNSGVLGDYFVLKLNSNGVFKWVKTINTTSVGEAITIDVSGNVIATGYFMFSGDFNPSPSQSYNIVSDVSTWDIFIHKLDSSGNFIWAKGIGSNGDDEAYTIATDIVGGLYIGGLFGYTVDFNPPPGSSAIVVGNPNSAAGLMDAFILKLDADGNFNWVQHIGGVGSTAVRYIALDNNVNVYSTGYFGANVSGTGSANFDESNSNFTLNSIGGNMDAFVYKLSQPTIVNLNSIKFQELSNIIFPNPTTGLVNLIGVDLKTNFLLYDLLGNNIKIENINSNNQLDISNLSNGVYFLINGNKNHKIVKQ